MFGQVAGYLWGSFDGWGMLISRPFRQRDANGATFPRMHTQFVSMEPGRTVAFSTQTLSNVVSSYGNPGTLFIPGFYSKWNVKSSDGETGQGGGGGRGVSLSRSVFGQNCF